MTYYLLRCLVVILGIMPASIVFFAADCLGRFVWKLLPRWRREMSIRNIVRSLKCDKEKAIFIAQASVINLAYTAFEVFRLPLLNKINLTNYVEITGEEYLNQAIKDGKGAILVTGHCGNWELLGSALALAGFPLAAVAAKQHNAMMDKLVNELREHSGMQIVINSGVRSMIRLLRAGKIIGLLVDQDPGPSSNAGLVVPFLDKPALTSSGASFLAQMTNVAVLPVFITRKRGSRYRHEVRLYPPIELCFNADADAVALSNMTKINEVVGDWIKDHPTEWFWLHNRWKSTDK